MKGQNARAGLLTSCSCVFLICQSFQATSYPLDVCPPPRTTISPRKAERKFRLSSSSLEDDDAGDSGEQAVGVKLNLWKLARMKAEDIESILKMTGTDSEYDSAASPDSFEVPAAAALPPGVEEYRRFARTYSTDVGHDGRFTIFGGPSGEPGGVGGACSLHPDVVLSLDDPLSYIRDVLSCGGDPSYPPPEEAVVFIPGPNTPHERSESCSAPPFPARVEYYSGVLGLSLAQLHAGSHLDRGNIVLRGPSAANTAAMLSRHGLVNVDEWGSHAHEEVERLGRKTLVLDASCRDELRMVGAARRVGSDSLREKQPTGLRRTIRKLVDAAVAAHRGSEGSNIEGEQLGLVLMAYSSSTVDVAEALRDWKDMASQKMPEKAAEALLRRAVTVVSIGSISKRFPDGPAYLHVSMTDDQLVSSLGCSFKEQDGGGEGAIYVHALSPYYGSVTDGCTMDAHNLSGCIIQFLAVLLRVNGTQSFRRLFDLASRTVKSDIPTRHFAVATQSSGMDVPPNLEDELLPAMIRATGGFRWLWNPDGSVGADGPDGPNSPIPSEDEADAILDWQYGYDAYEDIAAAVCQKH